MLLPTFNPTPTQTDAVLDALADPSLSLLEIAKSNNTSARALSVWLESPDIRPHADLINEALTRRARSQAAANFPTVIAAATKSIEAFNQLPAPNSADQPLDQAAADHYRRHCQAALRAARILLRIARFDANPPRRHTPHDDPSPPHRRRAEVPDLSTLAAILGAASLASQDPPATACHNQSPQRTSESQGSTDAVRRAHPAAASASLAPLSLPTAAAPTDVADFQAASPLITPKAWTDIAGGGAQAARPQRHPRKTPPTTPHAEGVPGADARKPTCSLRTAAHLVATAGLASGP